MRDLFDAVAQRVNVYCAIQDCSGIYYKRNLNKFLRTMKVVDRTVSSKKGDAFLSCTFFANRKEDLPCPDKIGSILRVHRGDTKKYKNSYQLNADIGIKASWTLFDPEAAGVIQHPGSTFTFGDGDTIRLNQIRVFAKKFFATVAPKTNNFADTKKDGKDLDFNALVLDRKTKNKKEVLRLCDGKEIIKLIVPEKKFDYIKPQDYVFVRSATSKKGKLELVEDYANILRLPKESTAANAIADAVKQLKANSELKKELELFTPKMGEELMVITKILDDHKVKGYTKLKDLFAVSANKGIFHRIKVSIIEIGPKNPEEWIFGIDCKTKER